jgi:ATP phosphoribosyltransferase-like protein
MTGDGRVDEIRKSHGAILNVVQCSGAMTFLAEMMKARFGIPYNRVSYFGIEDMAKALYDVADHFDGHPRIKQQAREIVREEVNAIYPQLQQIREDLAGKKIATELTEFARRYFAERNIVVNVEFSWGATEGKVVSGLADAIVEVTETESTIKAHGLRIIHELMQTNTQLIVNHESWKNPPKRKKIEQIALLLQGALLGEKMVGVKMNVPQNRMEEIIALLPSLNAPTVASLYQSSWFSVEVVVSEETVRELIPQLLEHGAEGIIEYPLNKVI